MEGASGHLKKLPPNFKCFQVKKTQNIVFLVYSDRSLALTGNPASNSLDFQGCLFLASRFPLRFPGPWRPSPPPRLYTFGDPTPYPQNVDNLPGFFWNPSLSCGWGPSQDCAGHCTMYLARGPPPTLWGALVHSVGPTLWGASRQWWARIFECSNIRICE